MDRRQTIISRIENLTEEQFEMLISLWSLSDQESAPSGQVENQTFSQPA